MAVQTPVSGTLFNGVFGDQRYTMAKFASVSNADTYNTGFGLITGFWATTGSGKIVGGTVSGGTITFNVTSGPDTNVYLEVNGY